MAKDMARALAYLHSKKLVHCDIKSRTMRVHYIRLINLQEILINNLQVSANFRVKLADFGFSRRLADAGLRPMANDSEAWTAPEVLLGERYAPQCIFIIL
jgi:serine/threonine protein kinase